MKKLMILAMMLTGVSGVYAQQVNDAVKQEITATQDVFVKIEVSTLPEAVTKSVAEAYADSTIKDAAVQEKAGEKVFQLTLVNSDSTEVTVLFKENGEEVKKD